MVDKNVTCLLNLVKAVITEVADPTLAADADWLSVINASNKQHIIAIVVDAVCRLPEGRRPPKQLLLQCIGRMAMQERMYAQHKERITSLAKFYAQHNIKMLLLKGYGCSLCYPQPEHRPTGDIDIFLFGQQDKADVFVERELGIKVHREYHKHSTFGYHGVEVENHAKFIDDVSHKSNIRFEQTLMSLLRKEACIESPIDRVLLPPPTFNALFLLRHTGEHFASNEITLRHVMDVGTFFCKYHSQIDWATFMKVCEAERMTTFFDGIATICVEHLGMNASCFASTDHCYSYHCKEALAHHILVDIFEEKEALPMSVVGIDTIGKKLKYGVRKSQRWWHNRWKYQLVYNENIFESFWWLARNRMMLAQ